MSCKKQGNTADGRLLPRVGSGIWVLLILSAVTFWYRPQVGLYAIKAALAQPGEDTRLVIPYSRLQGALPGYDAEHVLFLDLMLRASGLQVMPPSHQPLTEAASQRDGQANPPRIGIVAGHWGNDSGAICPDGLTEQAVNLDIARRVRKMLRAKGYRVDLLQEFDARLDGYVADALVSIHADSCDFINVLATGFKVARSAASYDPNKDDRLVDCLIEKYSNTTNLGFNQNSITPDMTSYHTFREIAPETPAAIIETGFLYLDRGILVDEPDRVARGIAKGVVCFLESK
jgi:N-acetylmuramoyl-L-alanine amidase